MEKIPLKKRDLVPDPWKLAVWVGAFLLWMIMVGLIWMVGDALQWLLTHYKDFIQ